MPPFTCPDVDPEVGAVVLGRPMLDIRGEKREQLVLHTIVVIHEPHVVPHALLGDEGDAA